METNLKKNIYVYIGVCVYNIESLSCIPETNATL